MDNKNEILFWKVFKNQYLLKIIFYQIQNTEWEVFKDPFRINENNKIRLNDVISLSHLLRSFSLFKYKIEREDYINIKKFEIQLFFNGSFINKSKEPLKFNYCLEILLSKRRIDFENCDLTKEAIRYKNIDVLKVLINKPYSMIVYQSSFEHAINYCPAILVKEILIANENNNNQILKISKNELIGKNLLKLASRNYFHFEEMLKLILFNEINFKLYNENSKINFNSFKKIKCYKTLKRLMDDDLVENPNSTGEYNDFDFISNENPITFENYNLNDPLEIILIILNISFKYSCEIYFDYFKGKNNYLKVTKEFKLKIDQIINSGGSSSSGNSNGSISISNSSGGDSDSCNHENIKLKKIQYEIAIIVGGRFYQDYKIKYNEKIKKWEPIIIDDSTIFFEALKSGDIDRFKSLPYCSPDKTFSLWILPSSIDLVIKLVNYFSNEPFWANFLLDTTPFYEKVCEIIPVEEINLFPQLVTDFPYVYFSESVFQLDFNIIYLFIKHFDNFNPNWFLSIFEELIGIKTPILYDRSIKLEYFKMDQLLMVLKELLAKYSKAIDNNNLPMKRLYEKIIIYFYEKLISCGNSNIDHINMFRNLVGKHSFTEFPFDFTTCVYYLLKRSPKFIKFIFDDSILLPSNQPLYGYTTIEETLESQLDISIFTFNYIFDLNSHGSYVNSFDDIINQLFNQLTFKTFNFIDIPDSNLKYHYITKRLNWILQFCLIIKRTDLFFNQLLIIKNFINYDPNWNLIKYTINTPSSKFKFNENENQNQNNNDDNNNNNNQINKPYNLNWINEKIPLLLPVSKIIKSFEYSNVTLELICVFLEINEIQKFIELNFNIPNLLDNLYIASIKRNKFKVVEFIFSNFNFIIPCLHHHHHHNGNNNFIYEMYLELQYLLNNHYQTVKNIKTIEYDYKISNYSNYSLIFLDQFINFLNENKIEYLSFKDSSEILRNQVLDNFIISLSFQSNELPINILPKNENSKIDKEIIEILLQQDCQLLIKNKLEQFLISLKINEEKKFNQLEKFYIENINNPFLKGFINGEIKYCELIKKYYPNQFKITKSSITKAISFDNIHIIKYYYQENNCIGLINSFKSDIQLFEFLILELKNHQDYKLYLEWL
ncbi:hypothetical protein ACTFIZ_003989 [Dictyostelium cf. discoideum]